MFFERCLHLFDKKYSINSILKYYYNLKELFSIVMYSASLLQSSVSHDPSEIIIICWFAAQETFLISLENSFAA